MPPESIAVGGTPMVIGSGCFRRLTVGCADFWSENGWFPRDIVGASCQSI